MAIRDTIRLNMWVRALQQGVVGYVAGDAVLGISYVLDPGEVVSFVTGPVLWQAACDAGAAIAGAIESWLVIPPQMRANSPATVEG
ncbi:MAG: hypothetical protein ACYCU8_04580 [Ferrimicrobium acidiphilum]|uniref:hypothetical protein n=1 Tax=Ferrimicrobium acidiphilum TaxID=121039 RepID=UPI0023F30E8D|nr:hypothetical protein [Ferrimicrobium acidiphilum]